ncbi:hypothetical protein HYH03_013154 [Edaphochlamys debaryana]|uniref:SRCR domain-containing protein n=1 Tax=Edaphochlamys debaryana TaxID=47281 RepID=A0A836BUT8_9CHLO|nr:hypothetical protein HYH03_013154 [Edaphochlamys debaryana]|eukprot:KAG2488304.1 hypothetical protein HYH03_013154 [Edaphochlamys debaryana]
MGFFAQDTLQAADTHIAIVIAILQLTDRANAKGRALLPFGAPGASLPGPGITNSSFGAGQNGSSGGVAAGTYGASGSGLVPGRGPVWLGWVHCDGHEERLEQCRHSGWGMVACPHAWDVGVDCGGGTEASSRSDQAATNTGAELRLRSLCGDAKTDRGLNSGFLQIKQGGVWGYVGGALMPAAALVACRQLCPRRDPALEQPQSEQRDWFPDAPIWVTNVACKGEERALSQCGGLGWGTGRPQLSLSGRETVGVAWLSCPCQRDSGGGGAREADCTQQANATKAIDKGNMIGGDDEVCSGSTQQGRRGHANCSVVLTGNGDSTAGLRRVRIKCTSAGTRSGLVEVQAGAKVWAALTADHGPGVRLEPPTYPAPPPPPPSPLLPPPPPPPPLPPFPPPPLQVAPPPAAPTVEVKWSWEALGIILNVNSTWEEHWGIRFSDLESLTLVDSTISDLPLSPHGPLIKVHNVGTVRLVNSSVADLWGRRATLVSNASAPLLDYSPQTPAPLHGALHFAAVQTVSLERFACTGVVDAHGWACLLVGLSEPDVNTSLSSALDLSSVPKVSITDSVIMGNSVLRGGPSATSFELADEDMPALGGVQIPAVNPDGNINSSNSNSSSQEPSFVTAEALNISGYRLEVRGRGALYTYPLGYGAVLVRDCLWGPQHFNRVAIAVRRSSLSFNSGQRGAVLALQALGSAESTVDLDEQTVMVGNVAWTEGGAISIASQQGFGVLRLAGGTALHGNVAVSGCGGAVISNCTKHVTMSDRASVSYNAARMYGGGIAQDAASLTAASNTYVGASAPISDMEWSLLLTGGSAVAGNAAGLEGGGVWQGNQCYGCTLTVEVSDASAIHSNLVVGPGGGLFAKHALVNLTLSSGGTLANNTAAGPGGDGGGAYLLAGLTNLTLLGGASLIYNEASGSGGGVYSPTSAAYTPQQEYTGAWVWVAGGSLVEGNAAMGSGSGGAVWAKVSWLGVFGSVVQSNVAAIDGGFLFTNWPLNILIVRSSRLHGNRASAGGFLTLHTSPERSWSPVWELSRCNVTENVAIADDGGVLRLDGLNTRSVSNISLTFRDSSFIANGADYGSGGVLYMHFAPYDISNDPNFQVVPVSLTFERVVAERNHAGGSGGVACVWGGCKAQNITLTMSNSSLLRNRAGHGGSALEGSYKAGGAIYMGMMSYYGNMESYLDNVHANNQTDALYSPPPPPSPPNAKQGAPKPEPSPSSPSSEGPSVAPLGSASVNASSPSGASSTSSTTASTQAASATPQTWCTASFERVTAVANACGGGPGGAVALVACNARVARGSVFGGNTAHTAGGAFAMLDEYTIVAPEAGQHLGSMPPVPPTDAGTPAAPPSRWSSKRRRRLLSMRRGAQYDSLLPTDAPAPAPGPAPRTPLPASTAPPPLPASPDPPPLLASPARPQPVTQPPAPAVAGPDPCPTTPSPSPSASPSTTPSPDPLKPEADPGVTHFNFLSQDTLFHGNVARLLGGGAIYTEAAVMHVRLERVTLTSNVVEVGSGGALATVRLAAAFGQDAPSVFPGGVELAECVVRNNSAAAGLGGALYIDSAVARLLASDCVFESNSAMLGGGALAAALSPTPVPMQGTGAAFRSQRGTPAWFPPPVLRNPVLGLARVRMAHNSATVGSGGAVLLSTEDLYAPVPTTLVDCAFENNTAAVHGGALAVMATHTAPVTASTAMPSPTPTLPRAPAPAPAPSGCSTIGSPQTSASPNATTPSNEATPPSSPDPSRRRGLHQRRRAQDAASSSTTAAAAASATTALRMDMSSCRFCGNKAGRRGGAVYAASSTTQARGSAAWRRFPPLSLVLRVDNCSVVFNKAGEGGGGIAVEAETLNSLRGPTSSATSPREPPPASPPRPPPSSATSVEVTRSPAPFLLTLSRTNLSHNTVAAAVATASTAGGAGSTGTSSVTASTGSGSSGGGGNSGGGGGLFLEGFVRATMEGGSTLIRNHVASGTTAHGVAYGGGGVYAGDSVSLSIRRSALTSNAAYGGGGGVQAVGCSVLHIDAAVINNSTAYGTGGAVHVTGCSTVVIMVSLLQGNRAAAGGGLYVSSVASTTAASGLVSTQMNEVLGNSTLLLVYAVVFADNKAATPSSGPTTEYLEHGGALFLKDSVAAVVMLSDLAANNSALYGSALASMQQCNTSSLARAGSISAESIDVSTDLIVFVEDVGQSNAIVSEVVTAVIKQMWAGLLSSIQQQCFVLGLYGTWLPSGAAQDAGSSGSSASPSSPSSVPLFMQDTAATALDVEGCYPGAMGPAGAAAFNLSHTETQTQTASRMLDLFNTTATLVSRINLNGFLSTTFLQLVDAFSFALLGAPGLPAVPSSPTRPTAPPGTGTAAGTPAAAAFDQAPPSPTQAVAATISEQLRSCRNLTSATYKAQARSGGPQEEDPDPGDLEYDASGQDYLSLPPKELELVDLSPEQAVDLLDERGRPISAGGGSLYGGRRLVRQDVMYGMKVQLLNGLGQLVSMGSSNYEVTLTLEPDDALLPNGTRVGLAAAFGEAVFALVSIRESTAVAREGVAQFQLARFQGWPGNYSLVFNLSAALSSSSSPAASTAASWAGTVPVLRVPVTLLPCGLGSRLDTSSFADTAPYATSCEDCPAQQYVFWRDDRTEEQGRMLQNLAVEVLLSGGAPSPASNSAPPPKATSDPPPRVVAAEEAGSPPYSPALPPAAPAAPVVSVGPSNTKILYGKMAAWTKAVRSSGDSKCKNCPENAICNGGANLIPATGFWHSSPNSTKMHACIQADACDFGDLSSRATTEVDASILAVAGTLANTTTTTTSSDARVRRLDSCQTAWYSSLVPGAVALAGYNRELAIARAPATAAIGASGSAAQLLNGSAAFGPAGVGQPGVAASPPAIAIVLTEEQVAQRYCLFYGTPSSHDAASYSDAQCSPGYTGQLCAACEVGYFLTSELECEKCQSVPRTAVLGVFQFLFSVVLVLYTVWTNLREGTELSRSVTPRLAHNHPRPFGRPSHLEAAPPAPNSIAGPGPNGGAQSRGSKGWWSWRGLSRRAGSTRASGPLSRATPGGSASCAACAEETQGGAGASGHGRGGDDWASASRSWWSGYPRPHAGSEPSGYPAPTFGAAQADDTASQDGGSGGGGGGGGGTRSGGAGAAHEFATSNPSGGYFGDFDREELSASEVLKTVIVHLQMFVTITRLNISWPDIIVRFQGLVRSASGAESTVAYSPSCLYPGADSATQAQVQLFAALLQPLCVILLVLLLWVLRCLLWNRALLRRDPPAARGLGARKRRERLEAAAAEVLTHHRVAKKALEKRKRAAAASSALSTVAIAPLSPQGPSFQSQPPPPLVPPPPPSLDVTLAFAYASSREHSRNSSQYNGQGGAVTYCSGMGAPGIPPPPLSVHEHELPLQSVGSHGASPAHSRPPSRFGATAGFPIVGPGSARFGPGWAPGPAGGLDGPDASTLAVQQGPGTFSGPSTPALAAGPPATGPVLNTAGSIRSRAEVAPGPDPGPSPSPGPGPEPGPSPGPSPGPAAAVAEGRETSPRPDGNVGGNGGGNGNGEVDGADDEDDALASKSIAAPPRTSNNRPRGRHSLKSLFFPTTPSAAPLSPTSPLHTPTPSLFREMRAVRLATQESSGLAGRLRGLLRRAAGRDGDGAGIDTISEGGADSTRGFSGYPGSDASGGTRGGGGGGGRGGDGGAEGRRQGLHGRRPGVMTSVDQAISLRQQLFVVTTVAVFILYSSWAQAAVSVFACYSLDDGSGPYPELQQATWARGYWIRNMDQECYSGTHAALYLPIGIVAVILVCVGPPLTSAIIMWRHRRRLDEHRTRMVYGFMYSRYRPKYFWWESVVQLQMLVLVVVEVFGRAVPIGQQVTLMLLAMNAVAAVNIACAPLRHAVMGLLEFASLAVLSATVLLGLFLAEGREGDGSVSTAQDTVVGVLIVVFNCAYLAALVGLILHSGRHALRRTSSHAAGLVRRCRTVVKRSWLRGWRGGGGGGRGAGREEGEHVAGLEAAADSGVGWRGATSSEGEGAGERARAAHQVAVVVAAEESGFGAGI